MKRPAIPARLSLSAALLATTALAGCGVTSTYGTGQAPEMALFGEMTGGILNKEKKEPIEYQPRAPLVMPPTVVEAQLPEPADSASEASPDWPMSRAERIAPTDARNEDDNPFNDVNQAEYRRLRPLAGVFSGQARPTYEIDESGKTEYYNSIVHGKKQRDEFRQAVAEAKGYGHTERRFLTDPPTEFREPVATAPVGEAALPKKKKKGNFLTRWWGGG